MSNPKISIVSPVYNVEKYIRRCVDSIIAQTFTDWELILVDDGSPDASGLICDQYSSLDYRIRVIHRQNGGVSAARQTGLDAAQGEYVIHADPDDWVEPTMLQELYYKATEENADVVICDYFNDYKGKSTLKIQRPTTLEPKQVLRDLFSILHGSCCNKLIKTEIYNKYQIQFPKNINLCEDLITLIQIFQHDVKVTYLNRAYYHYCVNNESITNRYNRSRYEMSMKLLGIFKQLLPERGFEDTLDKLRLDIFREGFVNDVLSMDELREGYKQNRQLAYRLYSGRWKLGFYFMDWHLYRISRYFLNY